MPDFDEDELNSDSSTHGLSENPIVQQFREIFPYENRLPDGYLEDIFMVLFSATYLNRAPDMWYDDANLEQDAESMLTIELPDENVLEIFHDRIETPFGTFETSPASIQSCAQVLAENYAFV